MVTLRKLPETRLHRNARQVFTKDVRYIFNITTAKRASFQFGIKWMKNRNVSRQ